jgi:CheY-like chemotaxis protein
MVDLNEVEILLVEDNPADAELALRSLKKNNLANNLIWVKDGAEALDFVFCKGEYAARKMDHVPKLILLDLRLPKIDGIEVLRRVKADEQTRSIPVVVLTSSKEERDIEACYKLGVNSYIAKPVNFEEFAKAITNLGLYWMILNRPPQ